MLHTVTLTVLQTQFLETDSFGSGLPGFQPCYIAYYIRPMAPLRLEREPPDPLQVFSVASLPGDPPGTHPCMLLAPYRNLQAL